MKLRREKAVSTRESHASDNITVGAVTQETFDAYITQNYKLDMSPEALAVRLDKSFVRALEAQADAITQDDEEAKLRADIITRLAANEGMGNKSVLNKHGDVTTKPRISINDFKISQIEAILSDADSVENPVIIEAVRNICMVYQIDFSDGNNTRLDTFKSAIKENRHIQRAIATTAFVAATGVASVVVASPAAADDVLVVNTNPNMPSPYANEIENGEVVKIAARTVNNPPQQSAPTVEVEDVVTVKPAPVKLISLVESKHVDGGDVVQDVVRIAKETIDAPKKIIAKERVKRADVSDDQVITIKPIPNVPAPSAEKGPATGKTPKASNDEKTHEVPARSAPDIIIDPSLAGETKWSADELTFIRDNIDMYTNIEKQTGVEWEIMVALHYRETSLGMTNPTNGQGLFQLYSSGEHFNPGPITKEEFTRQGILAANLLKEKAKIGAVYGELLLSDPDKVKDILFSYNGRASAYIKQSKDLGYALPAEGSPYVMNLADDKRNSTKNPNWGQILTDNGPLGRANMKPGAWVQIEGLVRINKIAHEKLAEKSKNDDAAKKAAKDKAAADAEQAKRASQQEKKVEEFKGWHSPVPEGIPITSEFGPRGSVNHNGEDFGAATGTPFFAAAGGTVKVITYDVTNMPFCKKALEGFGASLEDISDPIQKEVHVTTVIDGVEYVTIYAHMSEVTVAPNEIVKAGQVLGKTGGSGCSTGPHAHFEVRKNGVAINPHLLFDGDKWQVMGEIKPSSASETSKHVVVDQHDIKQPDNLRIDASDEVTVKNAESATQAARSENAIEAEKASSKAKRDEVAKIQAQIDEIQQGIDIQRQIEQIQKSLN